VVLADLARRVQEIRSLSGIDPRLRRPALFQDLFQSRRESTRQAGDERERLGCQDLLAAGRGFAQYVNLGLDLRQLCSALCHEAHLQ